jgi:hypothetical protein
MQKKRKKKKRPGKKMLVQYPSGINYEIFGRMKHVGYSTEAKEFVVVIESLESKRLGDTNISPGHLLVIDPRGTIGGWGDKSAIYNPRQHEHEFTPDMQQWMEDNPLWASKFPKE